MASAEQLATMIHLQSRGVHVLAWDNKRDLTRALLILRASLPEFPDSPVVLPTSLSALQSLGLNLFANGLGKAPQALRMLVIPQASPPSIASWLNGWRSVLAAPPGTLLIVRCADFIELHRRAPDLMSFVESEVYDATDMLPLVTPETLRSLDAHLPTCWNDALAALPGEALSDNQTRAWLALLADNAKG